MNIEVVEDIEALKICYDEWENILIENNSTNPFIELYWIINWWNFMGDGKRLFVLKVLDSDKKIIGICPLMKIKKKGYTDVEFIGYPDSNYADFIILNKYRHEVIRLILDYLLGLNDNLIFNFHGFLEGNENFEILKEYLKSIKCNYTTSFVKSYFIKIENRGFQEYYNLRKNHRSIRSIKGTEKSLGELGKLYYGDLDISEINKIFEIHKKRWKYKNDTSNFIEGSTKDFFKFMALNKYTKFKIHVNSLLLEDRIIAFIYGIEYKGRYILCHISHDDDFNIYGPGKILLKNCIEEYFDKKFDIIDFSIGYERYKTEWTDNYIKVSKLVFASNKIVPKSFFLFYSLQQWGIQTLKKSSRIVDFKRNTLGKVRYYMSKEYMLSMLTGIKRTVKREGIRCLILKLIKRFFSSICFSKEYIFYEKVLKRYKVQESECDIGIKKADINDIEKLSIIMNMKLSSILDRFHKNHKCFLMYRNNEIVSYVWVNLSEVLITNVKYKAKIDKNSSFIYEYFFDPKYKNSELGDIILPYICRSLCNLKLQKCCIAINKRDKSLANNISKLSFKPKYSLKTTRLIFYFRHLYIKE